MVGVRGGMKFYRGSAAAARAYVEADHSRADDYYLIEGSGVATRYVAGVSDSVSPTATRAADLDGDTYERWVAGYDVDTGRSWGRLRNQWSCCGEPLSTESRTGPRWTASNFVAGRKLVSWLAKLDGQHVDQGPASDIIRSLEDRRPSTDRARAARSAEARPQ